jgi:nucleotide-binding universal stress UspA family protein
MSLKRRRAYEAGHRAKFLVVVDDTPEADRALYFAARRAARTGVGLILLAIMSAADFQAPLGVGDAIKAEAEEEAGKMLEAATARARTVAGIEPERVMRAGAKLEEVIALIEEDEDIALLVLAAGTGAEGPGPLVSMLATAAGASFPVPVAIVPGHLADADIDALT